jgi:hypothetical protein
MAMLESGTTLESQVPSLPDEIRLAGRCRESINCALDALQVSRVWKSTHRLSAESASHTSLLVAMVRRRLWSECADESALSCSPAERREEGRPRSGVEIALAIALYHTGLLLDEQTQVSFTDALMSILEDSVPLSRQARFVSVGLLKQTAASIALIYSVAFDVALEASCRLWAASASVKPHARTDLADDWEVVADCGPSDMDTDRSSLCIGRTVHLVVTGLVERVCLAVAREGGHLVPQEDSHAAGTTAWSATAWSVLLPNTALEMPALPAYHDLLVKLAPWTTACDSVAALATSTALWSERALCGLYAPVLAAVPTTDSASLVTSSHADRLAAASTTVCANISDFGVRCSERLQSAMHGLGARPHCLDATFRLVGFVQAAWLRLQVRPPADWQNAS